MSKDSNQQYAFEGQRENEHFLFVFRRHIIAMRKGFYSFLLIFALSCVPTFIFMTMSMLWIALGGFILGLLVFFYHFIMWYFTVYIVTDQRIRQVTQKSLFGRNVIDLPLSKVQSVSYTIPGAFGEVFKFGTIMVQTMVGDLIIKNAENPEKTYNRLQNALNLVDKNERKERVDDKKEDS